jgi:hypothetical protein
MKKKSDRINRIYMVHAQTLSNFNPLPAETKASIHRTIGFVPFFRKSTKNQVIL